MPLTRILSTAESGKSQASVVLRLESEGLVATLEGRMGDCPPTRVIVCETQEKELRRLEGEEVQVQRILPK